MSGQAPPSPSEASASEASSVEASPSEASSVEASPSVATEAPSNPDPQPGSDAAAPAEAPDTSAPDTAPADAGPTPAPSGSGDAPLAPTPAEKAPPGPRRVGHIALFLSAFMVATAGLVYELVAGAMASYLLGDSITQFSLVIGCYLSAMGLGSWLSKFVKSDLLTTFVRVEIAVGLLGGFSALALVLSYAYLGGVRVVLFTTVGGIGTLVGLEIPVLMRILKDEVSFSDLVARVLAFDYLGALAASLAFPLLLVPTLGLPRTALAFGLLNVAVGLILCQLYKDRIEGSVRGLVGACVVSALLLGGAFVGADKLSLAAEEQIFDTRVLYKKKTLYQTIMLTRSGHETRLLLDGHLQFSSIDERRYHEALVHPAVAALRTPLRKALILGGGDGMALRELCRYESLESVTLVDLDPDMTNLCRTDPMIAKLNERAYEDPRATVINADALKWLEEAEGYWDVVIVDFPDPRSHGLAKLYSRGMYRLIHRHLARGGAIAIQSTSPYGPPTGARRRGSKAFWCIATTLEDADFHVRPYHCHVPSFGEWGFMLGTKEPLPGPPERLHPGMRGDLYFLNAAMMPGMFAIPEDLARPKEPLEVNRINTQRLLHYYAGEWGARIGGGN